MKELEILLEKYWIIKGDDKDLYYQIKDALPKFKSFIEDKLGYQLIINPYIIKLEKIPGHAEGWMGIEGFEDKMEYMFLCNILMFLEDRDIGEQFVLSQLTEFIQGTFTGKDKIDWTLYRHRRHLIKVLRQIQQLGLIKLNDGDEQNFSTEQNAEVLYENTGLSRYFIRNFTRNIVSYKTLEDIEKDEWLDADGDRGIIRRNRVYRRIVMSPAIYSEGSDDADYLYIKNYRNILQAEMDKYLESSLHIHKNGAFLVLPQNKAFKDTFPQNSGISDIVLQLNHLISKGISKETLKKTDNDILVISKAHFEALIKELQNNSSLGWSKEYREMKSDRLAEEVIGFMRGFSMLELCSDNKEVKILPMVGKIVGEYPEDFLTVIEGGKTDE